MAKKLTSMSWADMKAEMSIAGSPDKITKLADSIMQIIEVSVDAKNPAELINIEFALSRIAAEVKLWKRMYENRTGQEIG